jgi:CHAT domain-containing protein
LAEKLNGIRKIYFSPDGVYNQLNLNTLSNTATSQYLIDEVEIQLVTTTKDLITKTPGSVVKIKDAALFGFPNYGQVPSGVHADSLQSTSSPSVDMQTITQDSVQRFFDGKKIAELPGTKTEIETIQALLQKQEVNLQTYLYNEATEQKLKGLVNPALLHIATHGFFLADVKDDQAESRNFAGMESGRIKSNPLLRSGLVFAGAQQILTGASAPEGEDGILTAYEGMNLDLDKTEMVVMSACETGLGVSSNGEGVYGLQRAFQVAGAKSVLMSLWTVSDEATQKLMTAFYQNWMNGKTPREAFRDAQLSLRASYPQPYFWGAFVMVGN